MVSPFPGDWKEGWGPPNNVFLYKTLKEAGMLRTWMAPPQLPSPPLGMRTYPLWWWRTRDLQVLRSSPPPYLILHPAFYRAVRHQTPGPIVLKTFGFDMYLKGWWYRLRLPDLSWALRHPPHGWILTDDGSHPPDILERMGCRPPLGMLVVRNARPSWETYQPLPPFPLRLLVVGRLESSKGSDRLLGMLPSIMQRKDLELWIAGRGPLEKAFQRAQRQWPRLRLLSPLPWRDLQKVYADVHLVLHLVRHANTTLPLVEALHAGRGVIGIPAFPQWLDFTEAEGVRWFEHERDLIRYIHTLTPPEVEALSQAAYHQGRWRFPTWEEESKREQDWLCTILERIL